MIRAAIVGCGKMADQHAAQILNIRHATLVAACDAEPLMAQQLAERFRVDACFTSVRDMLGAAHPNVVHITTPPQSHLDIARECLEGGAHVYIEKPFTLSTPDAETLIAVAQREGLKLTAGHNGQFTHAMVEMRRLVRSGYLGGRPVHIESLYGYDLGDAAFATAMLSDPQHWVRQLPGSLLQNIMSHGVARIAEFLSGEHLEIQARAFASPFLQAIGHDDVVDEMRLLVRDENATTAYFTFSSQMRPSAHQLRVYGPKRSIVVDDDHQVVLRLDDREYKSYLRFFLPPMSFAKQYVGSLARNVGRFARRDFHLPNDAGLARLITAFYRSIQEDAPLPIPYREILLTSKIMDAALSHLQPMTARP